MTVLRHRFRLPRTAAPPSSAGYGTKNWRYHASMSYFSQETSPLFKRAASVHISGRTRKRYREREDESVVSFTRQGPCGHVLTVQ
jgi:hypothetical protein